MRLEDVPPFLFCVDIGRPNKSLLIMRAAVRGPVLGYGEFLGDSQVRRDARGFLLSRMAPIVPARKVPRHTHDEASFVFVLSGVYCTEARCLDGLCGPPTLIYNPPGTTHRDRFAGLAGAEFLGISIAAGVIREFAPRAYPIPIALHAPDALHAARALADEWVTWNFASPLGVEAICLEPLTHATDASDPASAPTPWLERARDLLHDGDAASLRLAEVAAECDVHPAHFARAFHRTFRCTPGEYMRRVRLQRAATLLLDSALPIIEVSLRYGFADQSHFTHAFTRQMGLAPAAYRRAYLRAQR